MSNGNGRFAPGNRFNFPFGDDEPRPRSDGERAAEVLDRIEPLLENVVTYCETLAARVDRQERRHRRMLQTLKRRAVRQRTERARSH